jgi:uncharacterized protein
VTTAASPAAAPGGPITPAERAPALDVLRGAALLGVLVVNMEVHRGPALYRDAVAADEPGTGPVDDVVAWGTSWLAAGKAYTVLAFLFGYGAAVVLRRAAAAGADPAPRLARRLAALFVLGLVHAVLLFFGDVLTLYAVAGTALLALRHLTDRGVLEWAAGLVLVPAALLALLALGGTGLTAADVAAGTADAERAIAGYTAGPLDAVGQRVRDVGFAVTGTLLALPANVGLLALGLLAARHRLLERAPGADAAAWRRVAAAGLGVGLPLNLAVATVLEDGLPADPLLAALGSLAVSLGPLVLAAGYVALLVLALGRPAPGRRLRAVLAPLGRLSLTAYLAQSLVAAVLFTGLGRYGTVGPAGGLAIALVLFAAQAALAAAYLRRRATGPAERLVRAVTYGPRRT